MSAKSENSIVNKIIKRYGPVIDLREDPQIIIEILRKFADDGDGGSPPGGTPPTGPTSIIGRVTNEDLMKAILTLAREVNALKTSGAARRTAKK